MMSSSKLFSLNKQKMSHKFAKQRTTYVSIHQDCIKSVEAEPLRHLTVMKYDPL